MQVLKNLDGSVPDPVSAWSEFRKIRTSEKVETTYNPTGTGEEVVCSRFLILEFQHSLLALLHRYQMGLRLGLGKQISASPKGHGSLFAWSRKGFCLRTSKSRAHFWAQASQPSWSQTLWSTKTIARTSSLSLNRVWKRSRLDFWSSNYSPITIHLRRPSTISISTEP